MAVSQPPLLLQTLSPPGIVVYNEVLLPILFVRVRVGSLSPALQFDTFYSDPWPIVTLAFFLRYPNPYASHVISCDVISREFSPSGSLLTTRLILKTATLPRWAPKGIISRSESWILEESEVDPQGKVVRCLTRNLEHVKAMKLHETQTFSQVDEGYVYFLGSSTWPQRVISKENPA